MLYIVNDLSIYKGFSNHDDLVDSLEILIKTLNLTKNDCMAFGDQMNDYEQELNQDNNQ